MGMTQLCTKLVLSAPKSPRGGKGFDARYGRWVAESAAVEAHNAKSCNSDPVQFFGLQSCNDCADGLVGTPNHMRYTWDRINGCVSMCSE